MAVLACVVRAPRFRAVLTRKRRGMHAQRETGRRCGANMMAEVRQGAKAGAPRPMPEAAVLRIGVP